MLLMKPNEISIGLGSNIHPDAQIQVRNKLVLGDHAYIGERVKIMCDDFSLGHYSKIHQDAFCYGRGGRGQLHIGQACWIAGHVQLDCEGGLYIGDGVTIGAQTLVWTHAQLGDYVEGAPDIKRRPVFFSRDSWIGSNCVVTCSLPERAVLVAGSSAIRQDLIKPNRIHRGSPATPMELNHMAELTNEQKKSRLMDLLDEFYQKYPAYRGLLCPAIGVNDRNGIWIDVASRTYTQESHPALVLFLKMMVPRIRMLMDGTHALIPFDREVPPNTGA